MPLYPCNRTNLLGSEPRMNPFNNDFFNGRCDRVRNPSTLQYDRVPWNVGVLNYQVKSQQFLLSNHQVVKGGITNLAG